MKRICSIYKSPRKNEMYLYVERKDALKKVPEGLLVAFGAPIHTFDLVLSPERQLAREDILVVLENLEKLQIDVDRNRLEQEMIFYLEKLDITEEKVRLANHCRYFREVAV